MRRMLCLLCLVVCAVGFISLVTPSETLAAETIQRTVRGVVLATNTAVEPQTIIVKVMLPSKNELIVGTRVPADIRITRGSRVAQLADLKIGETAELTYLKSPDGLIAQSIHVR